MVSIWFCLEPPSCGGWSSGARWCWHIQAKSLAWNTQYFGQGGSGVWMRCSRKVLGMQIAHRRQCPAKLCQQKQFGKPCGTANQWRTCKPPLVHGLPMHRDVFPYIPYLCIPYTAHCHAGKAPPREGREILFGCPSMSPVQLKL